MYQKLKSRKTIFTILLVTAITLSVGKLLADDDDDDDDERGQSNAKQVQTIKPGELAVPDTRMNANFKKECTSCHMLYVPGLLPARSWNKMMNTLDKHFGENATLDKATETEIRNFLTDNAADKNGARRSQKIVSSLAASDAPLSFSSTAYFNRKHHEIGKDVYKRKAIGSAANCLACHPNSEKGNFNEHEVKIPK